MIETMGNLKRTHYCNDFRETHIGQEVVVAGFVERLRELSNLSFIVLRDYTGVVQLAFSTDKNKELFDKANTIRSEFVIIAKGTVIERASKNKNLPTGNVEIEVSEIKILSKSKTPPFEIKNSVSVNDETALEYRFLDLRREKVQSRIIKRHKITKATRDFFDSNNFFEIETPILIKSTPEGARDYLVPSRVHKGSFYCLPQSPQTLKQLLMVSGFDRYFQIAKCFRDEDLRADRQPEFTQIDVEMSFVEEEDIISMGENYMKHLFKTVLDLDIKTPFYRHSFFDAMENYGSDKPDLRFDMKLIDLSKELENTEFKVFSNSISEGGSVKAINAKGLASAISRKKIDKLTAFVKDYGAKGLAYTRLDSKEGTSSFEKFLSPKEISDIREKTNAETNDIIFLVSDTDIEVVYAALGALRVHIAKENNLFDENEFNFSWVVDFPLMEKNAETGKLAARHHPFTSPKEGHEKIMMEKPMEVIAKAYDLVINGYEVGGGSIRISNPDIQSKMFELLGMSKELANEQFGFLLKAFEYGVPPHGGIAFGLDRLTMIITKTENIRDVIAFPKTQNARDILIGAPSFVSDAQLDELGITFDKELSK